jgi:MoaA/NifB/PqqE/SkfB family radical SAM enzyme
LSETRDVVATKHQSMLQKINEKLQSQGLAALSPETFCSLPFLHVSTTNDGSLRPCCRGKDLGDLKTESLQSLWGGQNWKKLRDDLLNGVKRKECQNCWTLEDRGLQSLRIGQNGRWVDSIAKSIADHMTDKTPPLRFVEFSLSNRCNFKCRMCSPHSSNKWNPEWPLIRDFYDEDDRYNSDRTYEKFRHEHKSVLDFFDNDPSFVNDIKAIAGGLEEVSFVGGEPLIDPLHVEILGILEPFAKNITLKYSTNLSTLKFKEFNFLEIWQRFKEVQVTVSMDGDRELNEYIRTGLSSTVFEENLITVRKIPNIKCILSICISAFNTMYLRETFEYGLALGCELHSNRVVHPKILDARIWPKDLRQVSVERLGSLLNTSLDRRTISTIQNAILWLEDGEGDEIRFAQFIAYTRKLDEVRKTRYRGFDE